MQMRGLAVCSAAPAAFRLAPSLLNDSILTNELRSSCPEPVAAHLHYCSSSIRNNRYGGIYGRPALATQPAGGGNLLLRGNMTEHFGLQLNRS
jgi:hypothetical protein